MSKTKERIINPKPHRAVNWNEKAIQKILDEHGEVMVGAKIDGFRCLIFKQDGEVKITTREGIEIVALQDYKLRLATIRSLARLHDDLVLDCEVWLPGKPFQEMSGLLRREEPLPQGVVPQFVVLDMYPMAHLLGGSPEVLPGFRQRFIAICGKFPYPFGSPLGAYHGVVCEAMATAKSIDEVKRIYHEARARGLEGIIVKDPKAPPRNGKVAGQWKLKPGCGMSGWEGDGKIIGYVWGEQGKANEGKIVGFRVQLEDGGESNATGLTQAQMEEYTLEYARMAKVASMAGPFAYIGRYCQVEAMERTDGGSLRHPKFVAFRDLDYAPGVKA